MRSYMLCKRWSVEVLGVIVIAKIAIIMTFIMFAFMHFSQTLDYFNTITVILCVVIL